MNSELFQLSLLVLMTLLSVSLLLCFGRLLRGPNLPDRTVAFDLISIHAVGIFVLFAVNSHSYVLLEGAIVTAVLGFLGTMMFARALERFPHSRWLERQSEEDE
ncbi:MAG: monovalent cation/H+ antiporter complex subunit F [Caldilineaceae bacterium]|nr:monovalent cation/H+ antiporter complex subunit F [Caldilineaceae bacterium]MCY3991036.1 monovalent cation/H+ antiporter complex subunit F [Caldilineaceae bacterium]MDE0076432.1 monovalent cation/H+ antiporter complex subunit F [Caldilineaceae bacterium]MDE0310910.1 monovalent cation/H+ antiporter complex subunit F [Caldilineaceae bacterium]